MPEMLSYAQYHSRMERILDPRSARVRWTVTGSLILAFVVCASILAAILSLITGTPFQGVPLAGILIAIVMQMFYQARHRWSARVLDHLDAAVRTHASLPEYLLAAAEAESWLVRHRLQRIADALLAGVPLDEAVRRSVPELGIRDMRLLAIGAHTGELEPMLERILRQRQQLARRRRNTTPLLRIYIPFLIGAVFAVTLMIGIFVLPKFEVIFKDFKLRPTGMTAFALDLPRWLARSIVPWIVGIGLFLMALYYFLKDLVRICLPSNPGLRSGRMRAWALGWFGHDHGLADVCWSLSSAMRSGMALPVALEDLERAALPRRLHRQITAWRQWLLAGADVVDAARSAGLPPLVCSILRIGGPQLADSMEALGDFYETRHARRNAVLQGMLIPGFTLAAAACVFLVACSVFLPLLALIDQVSRSGSPQ